MSELSEKYKNSPSGLLYVAGTGTGKTRKAIEATRGGATTVVGPSGLKKNFDTEEFKAFRTLTPRAVTTFANLARGVKLQGGKNLIVDESHNLRNPNTLSRKVIVEERSKYHKALLLSGSPIVNEPADLSSQVNLVAGKAVLPINKEEFYKKYYQNKTIRPNILQMIRGARSTKEKVLINHGRELKKEVSPYVYVEKEHVGMPSKNEDVVEVPMTKSQQTLHKYFTGKLPYRLRHNIQEGLSPERKDAGALNAYLSSTRQLANSTAGFVNNGGESPKTQKIVENIKEDFRKNKNSKELVYSNFLESGINEVGHALAQSGIGTSFITGKTSMRERAKQIAEYNQGKKRIMLLSGAGSEGINLPSVTNVHVMEPHWNAARTEQAASRGIRRDSTNRNVNIKTYVSTFPKQNVLGKLWHGPNPRTADEYLLGLSKKKKKESDELIKAIA